MEQYFQLQEKCPGPLEEFYVISGIESNLVLIHFFGPPLQGEEIPICWNAFWRVRPPQQGRFPVSNLRGRQVKRKPLDLQPRVVNHLEAKFLSVMKHCDSFQNLNQSSEILHYNPLYTWKWMSFEVSWFSVLKCHKIFGFYLKFKESGWWKILEFQW